MAAETHASVLEAGLKQRKGKAFFLALGLRFGQAGNSGLVQTFLVGYIATTLLVAKTVPTEAIVWGSLLGFVTVPIVGLLGDRFGRRPVYIVLTLLTMAFAFPMLLLITSGSTPSLVLAMVIGLNIGVLGLFSLESVTMAELFGSRTRFTQLALAKEIGGILATAIGPVVAATLTAVTGSWWPIAAMLVVYSLITLVSACLAPETRGRDLVRLEDAADEGAVVVHGADDLRIDERPDPAPGAGRGADRDGVGRHLRLRPGLLAARRLRHRGAAAPAGAGPRGRRPDRRSRPGVTARRSGTRSRSHPAEPVGDGCLPERIAGRTNLYPRIRYCGSAAFDPHTDGGFSELKVVRADQIRALPEGVSTEHGALAEPLAVALHAVQPGGRPPWP